MQFNPRIYQETGIRLMLKQKALFLALDPGLGKTSITLTALTELKQRTLIIAPLDIVYRVWPREIEKWDHTRNIKYAILHGPDKERAFLANVGIHLINPEGLKWLLKTIRKHRRFPWKILIVDESTEFKNFKSKRFEEHLAPVLSNFERRYALSGTPIAKSYLDLWAQYYILDRGARLGDNYYQYRSQYFYQADYKGYDWQLFPGAQDLIRERVKDITYRISGRDHLDLPEIFHNVISLEKPTAMHKPYRDMARDLIVEFEDEDVTIDAANAAVKTNKLQCISNGFLYISEIDPNTGKKKIVGVKNLHRAKVNALNSVVNELNSNPLLVGFHYKQDLALLLEKFPGTPYFGSGVPQQEKVKIERQWNKGELPLLFAQIHSTAKGLNLQESGYNIFMYSLTWSWLDFTQFIQRVARQGQKANRVIVHIPIIQNTIDELIYSTLDTREVQSDEFLTALKSHLEEIASQ